MSALASRYGAINLGLGFPDTDSPAEMLDAATQALADGVNQYATIAGNPAAAALVVVNDPHNPTGAVFSAEAKTKIVELATKFNAVILADQVYEHLVFDGPYRPIQTLPGAAERTVAVSALRAYSS